tara:strand:+ start:10565 stop:10834 length:270 start_codon:yes stop_codon:yes gene_type:complete
MDLTPRTSYADQFIKTFKEYFDARAESNDQEMKCADHFRHDEWKVIDDTDYSKNTRDDLLKIASKDLEFKSFVAEVITCMDYNRSMEEE